MGCGASSPASADAAPAAGAAIVRAARTSMRTSQTAADAPSGAKFETVYKMGAKLGSGGFATVRVATHLRTGEECAVKLMALPKEGTPPVGQGATRQEILNEVKILAMIRHANCLMLKEWFAENGKALIVTEYVRGGEVLLALSNMGSYSESDARTVVFQLISGLAYLHSLNVLHRDLKLENLMLSQPGNITAGLKIVDFGLARFGTPFDENDVCGTPMYVAPEVVGGYGPGGIRGAKAITIAGDMWGAGVILFMLLAGYAPFAADGDDKLFSLIRRGTYSFDDPAWDAVSKEAKDLIRKLLVVKCEERLAAAAALAHPWFSLGAGILTGRLTRAQQGLKELLARRRFKGAISSVLAVSRMRSLAVSASMNGGSHDYPRYSETSAFTGPPSTPNGGSGGGGGGGSAPARHSMGVRQSSLEPTKEAVAEAAVEADR